MVQSELVRVTEQSYDAAKSATAPTGLAELASLCGPTKETAMKKQTTSAAIERLEGVAADFLEANIAAVEKAQGVTVKDVEVAVVPDPRGDGPAVTVVVTT